MWRWCSWKLQSNQLEVKNDTQARPLELVHADLCSLPIISRPGFKYIMTFVDEATHYTVIYFLKHKSQTCSCFKKCTVFSESDTGKRLKRLRSDNSGEHLSDEWRTFYQDTGVQHSTGPPHFLEINGTAEMFNRPLLDWILPTLFQSALPVRFWEDALCHSVYALTLSLSQVIPGKLIQILFGNWNPPHRHV